MFNYVNDEEASSSKNELSLLLGQDDEHELIRQKFGDYSPSPTELDVESVVEDQAAFSSSMINLLKTILGAGMLAMPAAMASVGYIWGIALILVAGGLSAFSLNMFTVCASYAGRSASIARLSKLTYPQLGPIFDLAMAIKCFGVAVSFLIVIGDLMPSLALGLGWKWPILMSRRFWISAFMVFMTPLTFLRRLDSLKYTSFGGLVAVCYLTMLSIWNYCRIDAIRPPPNADIEPIGSFTIASLTSFPVFIFAFTCQQNILQIQNESKDNSPKFMQKVIGLSIGVSSLVYVVFSFFSYANFGRIIQNNVFRNYPVDSIGVIFARCLFALLSAFSYPLQTHPCRTSLLNLVPVSKRAMERNPVLTYGSVTSLIVIGSFVFAWFQEDLRLVSGFIGTFVGIPICYILPFVYYRKLLESNGESSSATQWSGRKLAAAGLAAFGVFAMIVSGFALIFTILHRGS